MSDRRDYYRWTRAHKLLAWTLVGFFGGLLLFFLAIGGWLGAALCVVALVLVRRLILG